MFSNKLTKRESVEFRKKEEWICCSCGKHLRPVKNDHVKRGMHLKCEKKWQQESDAEFAVWLEKCIKDIYSERNV